MLVDFIWYLVGSLDYARDDKIKTFVMTKYKRLGLLIGKINGENMMENKDDKVINTTNIQDTRYLTIQKKKDNLKKILLIEAILCACVAFFDFNTNGAMSVISFPLDHLALLLRKMSLSSSLGNVSAIIIYIVFCSIPLIILAFLKIKKRSEKIDNLLIVISILLFTSIYLMINPNVMQTNTQLPFEFRNIILTSLNITAVISYLILKLLKNSANNNRLKLLKSLKYLLIFVSILITYGLFAIMFKALLNSFNSVNQASNMMLMPNNFNSNSDKTFNYIIIVIAFSLKILPYIIDLKITFAIMDLIDYRMIDKYSKKSLQANNKLSKLAKRGLSSIVMMMIALSIFSLFLIKRLQFIGFSLDIPIFAILFAIASLILANLLKENQELKDENDLFV